MNPENPLENNDTVVPKEVLEGKRGVQLEADRLRKEQQADRLLVDFCEGARIQDTTKEILAHKIIANNNESFKTTTEYAEKYWEQTRAMEELLKTATARNQELEMRVKRLYDELSDLVGNMSAAGESHLSEAYGGMSDAILVQLRAYFIRTTEV